MADTLDISGFAKKVRAKYPGAYDQLSDQDLTAKVLNMHPQYAAVLDASKPEVRQFIGGMNNLSTGDMTKRVTQEGTLGTLTGLGFPETDSLLGSVQRGYTALANKYDTGHPIADSTNMMLAPFTLANALGEGVGRNIANTWQTMEQERKQGNYGQAALRSATLFNPITGPAQNAAITAGARGDLPALANAGGNIGGQTLGFLAGTPEGAAVTDATIGRVGQTLNHLPGTPFNFNQLLTKAIRPSIKNVEQLKEAVNALQPDLEAAMGGDKQTLDSFQQSVSDMRKSVWQQSQKLKPNASQMIDGQDIHDAIIGSISPRTKTVFPELADAIQARAENYLEKTTVPAVKDIKGKIVEPEKDIITGAKQIPISDAEDFLKEAHADLDPFYNKSPVQQATNIRSNADVAATQAEVNALRTSIHGQLADPTLRQKYGFLTSLDQQAQRRQAQVAIQALQDMPDRMSKTAAAWGLTKAVLKADPQEAASVLAGYATNAAIKNSNSPNFLINKALNPSTLGATVPPGIAGPAVAATSAGQHLVNWTYDPQTGSLVPASAPVQLQDQF